MWALSLNEISRSTIEERRIYAIHAPIEGLRKIFRLQSACSAAFSRRHWFSVLFVEFEPIWQRYIASWEREVAM